MRCIECGAPLIITNEPMNAELREENLVVRGVDHYKCPECGEVAFDSKMNREYSRAVDREYRKRCGLLLPEEIKAFRASLHLTQEQFQTMLGVGKLSTCRWETGRLAQSKTVDNLIRAYMKCPHLAQEALERAELGGAVSRKQTMAPSPHERVCEYLESSIATEVSLDAPLDPAHIKEWLLSIESEGSIGREAVEALDVDDNTTAQKRIEVCAS